MALDFQQLAGNTSQRPVFLLSRLDLCQEFNSFMLSDFDEVVHIHALDDVDYGPYDGGDRKKKPKVRDAISKKLTKPKRVLQFILSPQHVQGGRVKVFFDCYWKASSLQRDSTCSTWRPSHHYQRSKSKVPSAVG